MGTRDDEYDYLFKGEVMGSPTLHRVPFGGPETLPGEPCGDYPACTEIGLPQPFPLCDLSRGVPA